MKKNVKKIVSAALMAALVCVMTMVVKIPSPLKGYLNLGDCVVLVAGWTLSPLYAFLAAGLGSALADVFSGYLLYAPATFLIKGLMALVALLVCRLLQTKLGKFPARLIGGVLAEGLMVLGYFVFEGFLYGFAPSLVNVLPNALQGVAGLLIGLPLIRIFEKRALVSE